MKRLLLVASAVCSLAVAAESAPRCASVSMRAETAALSSTLRRLGLNASQREFSMAYVKKKAAAWKHMPLNPAGAACGAKWIAAHIVACTNRGLPEMLGKGDEPLDDILLLDGEVRRYVGRSRATRGELIVVGVSGLCQAAAMETFALLD